MGWEKGGGGDGGRRELLYATHVEAKLAFKDLLKEKLALYCRGTIDGWPLY